MIRNRVISLLLIAIYGVLLMHHCVPHEGHHEHQKVVNSISIDEDGCYVHSEDGVHECHHDDAKHQKHQHSNEYFKSTQKATAALFTLCLPASDMTIESPSEEKILHTRYTYTDSYKLIQFSFIDPTRGSPCML